MKLQKLIPRQKYVGIVTLLVMVATLVGWIEADKEEAIRNLGETLYAQVAALLATVSGIINIVNDKDKPDTSEKESKK